MMAGTKRPQRSKQLRPSRVHLSMNIDRDLDRQMRAWARLEKVSMASIVESALDREFIHRGKQAGSAGRFRVSQIIELLSKGRL